MSVDFPEIISIRGPVGTGKSSLAATVPGNCFWFDLEAGADRALDRYRYLFVDAHRHRAWNPMIEGNETSKTAMLDSLVFTRGEKVKGMMELWAECSVKYISILKHEDWDTIIVDTWKELWTTCHRGYLQELQIHKPEKKNIIEIEYAVPNGRMDKWISISKPMKKNLVLISHERPKRVGQMVGMEYKQVESSDGAMELDGYRHTSRKADWSLITGLENPCPVIRQGNLCKECKGWHFTALIEKSPMGQQLVGRVIRDPSYKKLIDIANMMGYKGEVVNGN